ncbi:MAG: hypothetical protein AUH14_05690 [Candidatus Rokubacteria bacterium 13_2_20CM_69_15_1]|nr:MAG: hypothetical protein AUH14_05690 [Candidatus Rokubacteria bacterium 13_2_20CM_69_15_1]
MRLTRCSPVAVIATLFVCGVVPVAHAQSVDELKQRIEELERSTREQVDALKRMLQQQEAERAKERRAQEERERTLRSLQDQVEQQQFSLQKQKEDVSQALAGLSSFFDLEAGAEQTNNGPPRFLGEDIPGNVYSGKDFKIRLGGSLRLHVQHNDTPVGESVSRALVPNTSAPGGGNNASREVFRAFVSRTRLNLAMQGPETVGAKTSAYFEMDFNQQANGNGEVNAVNNNPRLRWAIGRWAFPNFLVNGNELIWTFGQGDAFDQITPDTIDYNTLLAGLGDAERRNPRVEVVDKFPLTSNLTFLTSLGFERPLFDNGLLGGTTDCGSGCLSGFPAVSGGIGLEAGRLGGDFGIGATRIYARTTWGEFKERFTQGTLIPSPNQNIETNFTERTFDNQTAAFSVTLDRIGFNKTGQALTLRLKGGGVWTRGEGRITNSEFDRRVILDGGGRLVPAQSIGGWINPQFYLTDTLSLRWAGGEQWALNGDRPAITGTLLDDPSGSGRSFFRVNNFQSEVSLWWTPGPFTFALGYNFTNTNFKSVNLTGGSESRHNENNKVEFISWWSF